MKIEKNFKNEKIFFSNKNIFEKTKKSKIDLNNIFNLFFKIIKNYEKKINFIFINHKNKFLRLKEIIEKKFFVKFLILKKELIFEKSKNSSLKCNFKEEKLKNLAYINNIFDF